MKATHVIAMVATLGSGAAACTSAGAEREPVRSLLEARQERVIIQEWDVSCGAAVLATLLTYQMDSPITERQVALSLMNRVEYLDNPELVRQRQGFSLLDMKRYVSALGFKGVGYGQMTLKDLIEKAPVAVPVNLHGYNHFVIFRGVKGNRVLVADPAWGNRTMLTDTFRDAWLDYGGRVGRVGFVVLEADGTQPANQLAPTDGDFVALR